MHGMKHTAKKEEYLKPLGSIQAPDFISALSWAPDGSSVAAATMAGPVVLIEPSKFTVRHEIQAHGMGTLDAGFSPDGKVLATAGQDGTAKLWDVNGKPVAKLQAGEKPSVWVEKIAWSKSGLLATGAGKLVKVWSADGALKQTFDPLTNTVGDITWHPSEDKLAVARYGGVRVHTLDKTAPESDWEYKGSLLIVRWSPDGKTIACGCQDGSVHVWNTADGKDLQMSGYSQKVDEISWDPKSRYLATGGNPVPILWDFSGKGPAGSKPTILGEHTAMLSDVAYHPGGAGVAAGDEKGMILFHLIKLKKAGAIAAHESPVSKVAWSPDGKLLASGHANGDVLFWETPKGF